ncbi:unnamed protein product, partial [Allacma fusca]
YSQINSKVSPVELLYIGSKHLNPRANKIPYASSAVIVLLAVCFTAALAGPVTKTSPRVNPLLVIKDRLQPKFQRLFVPDLISKILENPPGIKEVWEQFENSLYDISDIIESLPNKLTPFIRDNNLKEIVEARLPRIAELATKETYEITLDYIELWRYLYEWLGYPYRPANEIYDFILGVPLVTAFDIPYVNIRELGTIINRTNSDAAEQYEVVIENALDDGYLALERFATKNIFVFPFCKFATAIVSCKVNFQGEKRKKEKLRLLSRFGFCKFKGG